MRTKKQTARHAVDEHWSDSVELVRRLNYRAPDMYCALRQLGLSVLSNNDIPNDGPLREAAETAMDIVLWVEKGE